MGAGNTILIVDDNLDNQHALERLLNSGGYQFLFADNGVQALSLLKAHRVDLVLLDVMMPEMDGYETCRRIRASAQIADIPVVMVTTLVHREARLEGIEAGADDFISKPIDKDELRLRVRTILRLNRYRRILEQADRVTYLESYDSLTHLPNRTQLIYMLNRAISAARQSGSELSTEPLPPVVVLCLALDDFSAINDTLGHQVGDQILIETASRLVRCVKQNNVIARIDGEKFVILQETSIAAVREADILAQRIRRVIRQPFRVNQQELVLTASIGISLALTDGDNADDLLSNATAALTQIRKSGKDQQQFFADEINVAALRQLSLVNRLRKAVDNDELRLRYLPKYALSTGQMTGIEALIYWQHPEKGVILPDNFITTTNESDLVKIIGDWSLHTACQQIKRWQSRNMPKLPVAVNIAKAHFHHQKFLPMIRSLLAEYELEGHQLELDLTESALIPNDHKSIDSIIHTLQELKALGIYLAIDDFGTGYSNLSYLTRLPVDSLKIDRSFIANMFRTINDATVTKTIIYMAQSLDLNLVAEGVETEEQKDFLMAWNCHEAQGYLFSRPVAAQQLESSWEADSEPAQTLIEPSVN